MTGIQYVTDEKGRKVRVLIDLKAHGAIWEDFWYDINLELHLLRLAPEFPRAASSLTPQPSGL